MENDQKNMDNNPSITNPTLTTSAEEDFCKIDPQINENEAKSSEVGESNLAPVL